MAATNAGYTTGANRDEGELHRRNVTSYDKTNGSHVVKLEAEDTKKLQKVRWINLFSPYPSANITAATTGCSSDTGRV